MSLKKKKSTIPEVEPKSFIDLSAMPLDVPEDTDARVKIFEIRTFENIATAADLAYKGNILFIRCVLPDENRESSMKTVISELKSIAKDCGGDMVIIGDDLVLLTTNGVRIDNMIAKRRKRIP